jgi:hypothetical protein
MSLEAARPTRHLLAHLALQRASSRATPPPPQNARTAEASALPSCIVFLLQRTQLNKHQLSTASKMTGRKRKYPIVLDLEWKPPAQVSVPTMHSLRDRALTDSAAASTRDFRRPARDT